MTDTTEHGRFVQVNDTELYCEVRGNGEPLVLLHGFTGSGRDWKHVFDLDLIARDRRVVTVDLRGHGRSANPAGNFTHRKCADDVRALLDELGVDRMKAIGLSFGANILLHLATQEPERVEAMVLVAPATYYPNAARALMRKTAATQIHALGRQTELFAATYDDMNFTPPYLSTITARTLIVNGDRDPLLPVEQFVEMYRAIERSALWIVPGVGHGPIFAEWRERFATAAIEFLSDRGLETHSGVPIG